MKALTHIDRQIARLQREASLRRDLHGHASPSYRIKRAQLAEAKNERLRIKRAIAERAGLMVLA